MEILTEGAWGQVEKDNAPTMEEICEGYPCDECKQNKHCSSHVKCTVYRLWLADAWKEVTQPFKRKEKIDQCIYRLFGAAWRQQSSQK